MPCKLDGDVQLFSEGLRGEVAIMRNIDESILLLGVLVLLGCGSAAPEAQPKTRPQAQPAATPQAQPKAKDAKKAETATLEEAAYPKDVPPPDVDVLRPLASTHPLDTPAGLALFMADNVKVAGSWLSARRNIVSALTEAGEIEQALEVAEKTHTDYKVAFLTDIAFALVEAGDMEQALATVREALEVVQKSKEVPLFRADALRGFKIEALRVSALVLLKAGDKEQALAALKQALEVVEEIEDASTKVSALRTIASALAKAGEVKQAIEVAQKIESAYWKTIVLRDIALVLVEAGDKEQALATLKQALEVAQKIEGARDKALILSTMALALAKAGEIKQAVEVGQKIESADTKARTLSIIALTLATEPIPENKKDNPNRPVVGRMKESFTPEEKQLAKQLVEAMQGN